MVALAAADPRLLPGGGRRRPPLLALPRGPLRARDQCAALVRAGAVRVNPNQTIRFDKLGASAAGGIASCTVMPAHSASKTRVNALKSRASTSFFPCLQQERRGWPGQARP